MHLMIGNKTAYRIKQQPNRGFHYIYSHINNVPSLEAQAKVTHKMELIADSKYAKFQQQYLVQQEATAKSTKKQGTGFIAKPSTIPKVFYHWIFIQAKSNSTLLHRNQNKGGDQLCVTVPCILAVLFL